MEFQTEAREVHRHSIQTGMGLTCTTNCTKTLNNNLANLILNISKTVQKENDSGFYK